MLDLVDQPTNETRDAVAKEVTTGVYPSSVDYDLAVAVPPGIGRAIVRTDSAVPTKLDVAQVRSTLAIIIIRAI